MAVELLRTLPNDVEAERSILGAIILDNDAIHRAGEILRIEDFYYEAHRTIFRSMLELSGANKPKDQIILLDALRARDEVEKAGGPETIAMLTDGLPRATNVAHYAGIVRECAAKRKLIQLSHGMMERSFDSGFASREVIEEAQHGILDVQGTLSSSEFFRVADLLGPVWSEMEEKRGGAARIPGIKTGFSELDRMTGGFRPGTLNVVAGRPGHGKTALSLSIAAHAALEHRKTAGIFSLEMSRHELVNRLLCCEANVDSYKLDSGYLSSEDLKCLTIAAGKLSEIPLYINDAGGIAVSQIRAKAQRLAKERGLDLLVVDYLQLVSGASKRYSNRVEEVSEVSRHLKLLAKDLNIPIIAASQLNRALEHRGGSRRPQLSDLRESGSIEQDADLVLFISREELSNPTDENTGLAEVVIGKQRNGPIGSFQLAFIKQFTKFADLWAGR